MKLVHKLWLGIGLALMVALGISAWFGYHLARQSVETMLLEEGRTLHATLMAVRRTYQKQFLDSGLPLDERTVGFLPAHAMTRIAADFQRFDNRGVHFNNVSDRARNPANQADAAEMEAIRHFRAHPGEREWLTTYTDTKGEHFYLYATPIWTEPHCLTCHGRPEDAPATIRHRYKLAYGYQVGELRGILSLKLPARQTEARILGLWWQSVGTHLTVVALSLVLAGGLMHRLVVRRLEAFSRGAQRLAAGDYTWRASEQGRDEAAELACNLNAMARGIQQSQGELRLAASVFHHAREGILITDAEERIVDVNPAFTRITGYSREEALGQTPRLLASGLQDPAFYAELWRTLKERGFWAGEIWDRRKNGEDYPEFLSIAAVRDEAGRVSHYIGVFNDITLVKKQEAQLEHLAHHDPLTGVPNRVLLADRMRQAIAQAKRSGGLLAVCYLDLDGFKPVNDSLGHEAGDHLLVEMARRLAEALRGGDTVARLGGDEFVLLLQGLENQVECEATLNRLLGVIRQPVQLDGHTLLLTASIGVSLYPQDDDDPDALLRHADQAMYAAKQAGGGSCAFHDAERDRRLRQHRQSREGIRKALEAGEMELHYQPQVNMAAGEVAGLEALIRWRHPEQGLIPPSVFLPVIENTDLEVELGHWVLSRALDQLDAWHHQGLRPAVSVNISAQHIQQGDFLERLQALLAAHPAVSATQLKLEILESAALQDLERVSATIRACARLGVEFALDDFGTGYSSLTYLKLLPAQTLKIDQSFVRDMLTDADDLAIVEGVIALAEAFGRSVVAEGVESLEAGLLLLQLGCNLAQGYAISRPLPPRDIPAWMASWQSPRAWSEENFKLWHREDFALLLAEHHHREWVDRLAARVEAEVNGHEAPPPLEVESCRFGRWYHGSGQVRYGQMAAYQAIGPAHAQVHALGQELLALKAQGRSQQARARLPELFAARDELLDRLHTLQAAILAGKR